MDAEPTRRCRRRCRRVRRHRRAVALGAFGGARVERTASDDERRVDRGVEAVARARPVLDRHQLGAFRQQPSHAAAGERPPELGGHEQRHGAARAQQGERALDEQRRQVGLRGESGAGTGELGATGPGGARRDVEARRAGARVRPVRGDAGGPTAGCRSRARSRRRRPRRQSVSRRRRGARPRRRSRGAGREGGAARHAAPKTTADRRRRRSALPEQVGRAKCRQDVATTRDQSRRCAGRRRPVRRPVRAVRASGRAYVCHRPRRGYSGREAGRAHGRRPGTAARPCPGRRRRACRPPARGDPGSGAAARAADRVRRAR